MTRTPHFTAVKKLWDAIKPAAAPASQELAAVKLAILRPHSHDRGAHWGHGMDSILERLQQR